MQNTVNVYTGSVACLKDPKLYEMAHACLPPQRADSADRMKVESGRMLSAGAGLLLMAALDDYMGGMDKCVLRTLRFGEGEHGKPYLTDYPEVHVNLSHSGSRVLCAVGPAEVGCDIEQIDGRHIDKVIRCLAESEQRIAQRSDTDFFRIWTLKESILKLSGQGLLIPLKSFEVGMDPLSLRQGFLPEPVVLKEYKEYQDGVWGERYCCSCASSLPLPDAMIEVNLEKFVAGM